MATSITAATLTVGITEQITLNGQTINSTNELSISSINEVSKRIFTIPTATEVELAKFSTEVGAGQFIAANTKYIRITNKDNTNFVRVRVKDTGGETFDLKLEAMKSIILGNLNESVSATAGAFAAFATADTISAQADTAAVDIEMFVATT